MKQITVYAENIIKAAKENPQASEVIKQLFPEAFIEEKIFCKIGCVLIRESNPNNIYTLFKWNGEVRLLNITHNKFWDSTRNLKVSELKDYEYLTVGEFKKLIGSSATIEQFKAPIIEQQRCRQPYSKI